jgi:hypothetical protein
MITGDIKNQIDRIWQASQSKAPTATMCGNS